MEMKEMKIALHFAFTLSGGVIPYFKEMISLLPEVDSQNEYLLLITDKGYEMIKEYLPKDNMKYQIFPFLGNMLYRAVWEQTILPYILKKERVDVLYSLSNRIPFLTTLGVKTVLLVGTIGPFVDGFIKSFGLSDRIKQRLLSGLIVASMKSSDITIFESHYTKNLIQESYGYKGRYCINYHGRPNTNAENYSMEDIETVRQKFRLERDYFLYVGDVVQYKNLKRTIEAFSNIKKKLRKPMDFIVAGPPRSESYLNKLKALTISYGVDDCFRFIGRVAHEDVSPLSLGCSAFVFPCKYENLSYALIEALTLGLPIVTTTGTAMPETCQDAALYFEAEDVEEFGNKMIEITNDDETVKQLKLRGLRRALDFKTMKEEIIFLLDIFQDLKRN